MEHNDYKVFKDENKLIRKLKHHTILIDGKVYEAFSIVARRPMKLVRGKPMKQHDGEGWEQVYDKYGAPMRMTIIRGIPTKSGGFA